MQSSTNRNIEIHYWVTHNTLLAKFAIYFKRNCTIYPLFTNAKNFNKRNIPIAQPVGSELNIVRKFYGNDKENDVGWFPKMFVIATYPVLFTNRIQKKHITQTVGDDKWVVSHLAEFATRKFSAWSCISSGVIVVNGVKSTAAHVQKISLANDH